MKRLIVCVLLLAAAVSLGACSSGNGQVETAAGTEESTAPSVTTVGIALPDEQTQRWNDDGSAIAAELEKMGVEVILRYAENDAQLQAQQIHEMIAASVDCLVVTTVDSLALTEALHQAKTAGIPVVAYDRLPVNTDAITCYCAYDSQAAGSAIGQYIVQEKQLDNALEEGRSYTVEFFMGAPEDNNAVLFHEGVMLILQPYLDSGVLVCCSGRTAFEDTCISGWSETATQDVCERYLSEHYAEATLDICVAASDTIAYGCRAALENAGYTADNWPVITGQGAQSKAVSNILAGWQTMTVYIDTAPLVADCVSLVQRVLAGDDLADLGVYNNGAATVPADLYAPVTVDAENYRQILIDSGVYTEEEINNQ